MVLPHQEQKACIAIIQDLEDFTSHFFGGCLMMLAAVRNYESNDSLVKETAGNVPVHHFNYFIERDLMPLGQTPIPCGEE